TNTIQICDHLTNGTYEDIRKALPGIAIVQVVHVTDESSINEAVRVSEFADAVLLDSGNQKLAVKELGGTGRKHDWRISARIRAAIKVPLFLAGGLNSENLREAIETVQPFGIDLCSSVRTDRKLDKTKLERLFEVVHRI
ncbi:MAG TPA: phosphoribosylanthranilate isomerase, partial [bacterium]|nr:phosphoribosylanthranilate isomerase [bacterium]